MTYNDLETSLDGVSGQIDNKVIKKIYSRTNNENVLEIVFERDPNLCLRMNKILINATVEVPDEYVVENGFIHKCFSMLTVEVESQVVSSNRAKLVSLVILPATIQKYINLYLITMLTMFF